MFYKLQKHISTVVGVHAQKYFSDGACDQKIWKPKGLVWQVAPGQL